VLYNVLKRNDSGQAGMTSKEGFPTFYEYLKYDSSSKPFITFPANR
jgi:hypothetical protein